MAKKIKGYIKLQVKARKADPSPPIGPALGQRRLNIMEFCKGFNAATQDYEAGTPLPTIITYYEDNSFTFITKTPPASYLLKKYANITRGAKATKKEAAVGKISIADCQEIAKIKLADLNTNDIELATKIICGSAISMGLEVVKD